MSVREQFDLLMEAASRSGADVALGRRRSATDVEALRAFFGPLVFSDELEEWLSLVDLGTFGQVDQFTVAQSIHEARYQRVVWSRDAVEPDHRSIEAVERAYDHEAHRMFPFCLVPLWQWVDMVFYAEIGVEPSATSRVFCAFQELQLGATSLTELMMRVRVLASEGEVPEDLEDFVADLAYRPRRGDFCEPNVWGHRNCEVVELGNGTDQWPRLWQEANGR